MDDAALSCGGLVWEQSQGGYPVAIWTICAGEPPENGLSPFAESLHARWDSGIMASAHRRAEDAHANRILGVSGRYFPIQDCIYRQDQAGRFLYDSEESLFFELHPAEGALVETLAQVLAQAESQAAATVVCPLALGGHVDHRLTRAAAEKWQAEAAGGSLWYYADYPYVLHNLDTLDKLAQEGWKSSVFLVSEEGIETWLQAVAAHRSQISTFWENEAEMRSALRAYAAEMGGVVLWQKP
jgi:LmbE family N-acetylglucosaminyl deacetylase